MADDIDIANEVTEIITVAARAQRKPEAPKTSPLCLNCSAETIKGRRWCDKTCMESWENENR